MGGGGELREKYKKGWCVFYGFFYEGGVCFFMRVLFIFLVECFLFCPCWWCCWWYSSSFGSLPTSCAYGKTDSSLGCSTLDHSWKNPCLFVCVCLRFALDACRALDCNLDGDCFNFFWYKVKYKKGFVFLWVFYFLWYFLVDLGVPSVRR